MSLTYSPVTVSLEFPDGATHREQVSISNVPDIDRLTARIKNTVAEKLDLVLTIPEVTE